MLITTLTLFSQESKIKNKTRLFIGPNIDVTPLTLETGIIGGVNIKNKWSISYQYLYSFPHDYNYQAIDISRIFDVDYDNRFIAIGLKSGIYDGYYLNFRPYVRAIYILKPNCTLQLDMSLRALAPDMSVQLIFYIW